MTTPDLEALARNDRYLREFVEALRMCPYAQACRESGKLQRRVLHSREEALPAIRQIEDGMRERGFEPIDIAQLEEEKQPA